MQTILGIEINNKIYTNLQNKAGDPYIKNFQYNDSIFLLSPTITIDIVYPLNTINEAISDINNTSNYDKVSGFYKKLQDVSIIFFDNEQDAKDGKNGYYKLVNGIICSYFSENIDKNNGIVRSYTIVSRNYTLSLQSVNYKKSYSLQTIQQAIEDILNSNGFGRKDQNNAYIKNRIYPKYFNQQNISDIDFNNFSLNVPDIQKSAITNGEVLNLNTLQFEADETVYESLLYIVNEKRCYLTTLTVDNVDYLYFLDTGEFADKFAKEELSKVGLSTQKVKFNILNNDSEVLDYSLQGDFDLLYDNIELQRKSSLDEGNDIGNTINIKKKDALDIMKVQNAGLQLTKTLSLEKQLSNKDIQEYGEFVLQQSFSQGFNMSFKLSNVFINYKNPNQKKVFWQKGAEIIIESNYLNLLFPELYQSQFTSKKVFTLIGENIDYSIENGLTTELQVLPTNFLK